jgi:hypothetical protein
VDIFSMAAGFLIGVGVSVLAPPFWRKCQAAWNALSEWITRPRP